MAVLRGGMNIGAFYENARMGFCPSVLKIRHRNGSPESCSENPSQIRGRGGSANSGESVFPLIQMGRPVGEKHGNGL